MNQVAIHTEEKLLIETNKDFSNTNLVVFISQCLNEGFKLQFSYLQSVIGYYNIDPIDSQISLNFFSMKEEHVSIEMDYSSRGTDKGSKYFFNYDFLPKEETKFINRFNRFTTISLNDAHLYWNNRNSELSDIFEYQVYIIDASDNETDLNNLCVLNDLQPFAITNHTELALVESKEFPYGLYKVNILARMHGRMAFILKYEQLNFEFKNTGSEFWMYFGIALGCSVLIAVHFAFCCIRRGLKLLKAQKENQLTQLIVP